tara:strand:- start:695 stop:2608 length:1914 start_codon:yes stop_codon:yes gene_type:complete
MAVFKGFKPQGLQKIATRMGYAGSMDKFDDYMKQNPDKEREMIVYKARAQEMAKGGSVVKMQVGGQAQPRQLSQATVPTETNYTADDTIGSVSAKMMETPTIPQGGVTIPVGTQVTADQEIDTGLGQVAGTVGVPTAQATTTTSNQQAEKDANVTIADKSATAVDSALAATSAAQMTLNDPRSQVLAAQQTASSVGNLSAAQGNATLMSNPIQRQIQSGEIITGAANAQTASTYTEQIQAATATPTDQATVQGQLATLTNNFDASNPPSWAAGALRGVQAQMAARGLGASSIAGQAMVQAALESALPIAQADAQVIASFESQNLTNRQQRAMLAAQQRATFMGQEFDQNFQARVQNSARIGDIANMNFTAEQNIAMENSRAVNTMNLNNLTNRQAMISAEAAALSNLDMSNLNNRQQASVNNAQSFLQQDMANLSNQQQTDLFKAQQRTQALFTDQAAENASRQFNATSQNQVDQFFANLATQTAQFNATQTNAQSQFNAGQVNTVERFNAEMNNQRDQYNATNQLAIAQNNAVWRREIATADTAAVNRANELNANAVLDISKEAYDNLWSYYSDTMEWAWTSADNQLERLNKMALQELSNEAQLAANKMASGSAAGTALGGLIGTLGKAAITKGLF